MPIVTLPRTDTWIYQQTLRLRTSPAHHQTDPSLVCSVQRTEFALISATLAWSRLAVPLVLGYPK